MQQDTREKILQATMRSVAEDGMQGATTAGIARRAGVGEGSLYRHFRNKDDLFEQTASHAIATISGFLQHRHSSTAPLRHQYITACNAFLQSGLSYPLLHRFMEQYRDSPQGIAMKKRRLNETAQGDPSQSFIFPLGDILLQARNQGLVKNYPFQVLAAFTIGPLAFILKGVSEGLLELDENLMSKIAASCWDSIKMEPPHPSPRIQEPQP